MAWQYASLALKLTISIRFLNCKVSLLLGYITLNYIDNFIWKPFHSLTREELMSILKLRQDVFMVEQQSLYEDIDGLDEVSEHLLLMLDGKVKAYARLRTIKNEGIVKFERIVVAMHLRGKGIGDLLVKQLIDKTAKCYGEAKMKLSAQVDAMAFYEKWGFKSDGEEFDDGGIPHINMLRA